MKGRLELLEQRKATELEADMEARLNVELDRLRKLDAEQREVLTARKHVVEDILTLKCPRCAQAFLDFNGCMALTCGNCNHGVWKSMPSPLPGIFPT